VKAKEAEVFTCKACFSSYLDGSGSGSGSGSKKNYGFCNMAGLGNNPVQGFRTGRANHWEFLRLWTGFELPSSCTDLPCYALNRNRNSFCVMRWPHIYLGAQNLNGFNGQNTFQKIAGSKFIDEYYNTYPKK
jgi:hypothetical protein